jgi:hypothetical protein
MYKIRPSKKCRYKVITESTKHSRRNSDIPEEFEGTRRRDARKETTRFRSYIATSGRTKWVSSQKELERPVLGRGMTNTGLISVMKNNSRRRMRRETVGNST